MTGIAAERLDTLLIARLETSARPPGLADVVKALRRFAPRNLTDAQWRETVDTALDGLRGREIVDGRLRLQRPGELARRIGRHGARTWKQLAERVLPALALGVDAGDGKAHARLAGRDAWAAAIAARTLGVWRAGPPPSPSSLCDVLVWQDLGLAGTPKRCPPEVRAHFIRRHAGGDAGPPERLVRALAARVVDAPRVELQALRDGLVRLWLAGREVTARTEAAPSVPEVLSSRAQSTHGQATVAAEAARAQSAHVRATVAAEAARAQSADGHAESAAGAAPAAGAAAPRSLVADVRAIADAAREGVFGERKVFISAIWERLREMPAWASLALDELKARLVAAHRNRELVLARADLVAAMDPELVDASETRTDGATFHFVVREPRT